MDCFRRTWMRRSVARAALALALLPAAIGAAALPGGAQARTLAGGVTPAGAAPAGVQGQVPGSSAWLDEQPLPSWNTPGMAVPTAPMGLQPEEAYSRCAAQERPAESPEEAQVTAAGWRLFGSYEGGWGARIVRGLAAYDGMCRPLRYHVFVFVDGRFAGTISPAPMDSRTDMAGDVTSLYTAERLMAEFRRYTDRDPLCCPSGQSMVEYQLDRSGPVLRPLTVAHQPTTLVP